MNTATATSSKQVLQFSPHTFRADAHDDGLMPRKAPKGRSYFVVAGLPTDRTRKYLYRLCRDKEGMLIDIKWAPFKTGALSFDDLSLVTSFVEMIHERLRDDPDAKDVFLSLEVSS